MMKPAGCAHAADHGKRLVIKIGSSTLTTSESKIDYAYLAEVTDQVARVRAAGWRPIVVTSAAIACGLERLSIEKRPHDMPSLQAAASVGQSALSTAYAEAFARHGIVTSTVLLTRRDTADRRAYLHARDTFDRLLELGVVDSVIPEPQGGAHLAPAITFEQVDQAISRHLGELLKKKPADLAANRYQKFRKMGAAAPQKESQ